MAKKAKSEVPTVDIDEHLKRATEPVFGVLFNNFFERQVLCDLSDLRLAAWTAVKMLKEAKESKGGT